MGTICDLIGFLTWTIQFWLDSPILDSQIPFQISDFVWCFSEVITTFIMISYATPEFLYVILPMILIFLAFQRFYIVTSRQLKRLYSVSKSPLFSHFSETVTGSPVIRAYQQTQRWFFFHINNHSKMLLKQLITY